MKNLEDDNRTGINHAGNLANTPVKCLAASTVMGDKVHNAAGQPLGTITDIMMNVAEGKIEYVVIRFGGFLGIGAKYFAIPILALSIDSERHAFLLNQNQELFKRSPGFDQHHWPRTNAHRVIRSLVGWGGFMGANTGTKY